MASAVDILIVFLGGILTGEILHQIIDRHGQLKRFWPVYMTVLFVLLVAGLLITYAGW